MGTFRRLLVTCTISSTNVVGEIKRGAEIFLRDTMGVGFKRKERYKKGAPNKVKMSFTGKRGRGRNISHICNIPEAP